jgi:hypothetical protein
LDGLSFSYRDTRYSDIVIGTLGLKMTSTFTPNKNLEQPAPGDYNDAWATPVNADWQAIDTAFGGTAAVALSSTNVVLTVPQYQPPNIILTGTLTANVVVYWPLVGGIWSVWNTTTGSYTVTLDNDVIGSRNIILPQGQRAMVVSDGGNIDFAITPVTSNGTFVGTLTGCTVGVNGTFNYTIAGGLACIYAVNQVSGTSNLPTMTLTGLPAVLQPTYTISGPCGQLLDNGFPLGGAGAVSGSTLFLSVAVTNLTPPNRIVYTTTGFTTSGAKGITAGFTYFYPLL